MTPEFSEAKRYEYPLGPSSLAVDVGSYEGNFSKILHKKYGCRIDAYEPVSRFWRNCAANLEEMDKVRLYNFGVAATAGTETMHIQNDSTGKYAGSEETETCRMLSIFDTIRIAAVPIIDLIKLNCEGAEYEILEALIASDIVVGVPHAVRRFANIQVQFHTCVNDWQARYDAIAGDLSQTHELTWRTPFVWENWKLKT